MDLHRLMYLLYRALRSPVLTEEFLQYSSVPCYHGTPRHRDFFMCVCVLKWLSAPEAGEGRGVRSPGETSALSRFRPSRPPRPRAWRQYKKG